jgi:hypothetical protein
LGRIGTHIGYWLVSQRERDQDVDGLDNFGMDLGEVEWGDVDWTGLVWLRIGKGGELLWIRY